MKKKRVMIIEDSLVEREFISYIINQDPRLEVVASYSNAEDAISSLNQVSPDVITLDIRLPGMTGLEATLHIMSEKPTPIVVISANVESEELNISMNALRAGALTVIEKPLGFANIHFESRARQICDQIALMSEVIVLRQRSFRDIGFTPSDNFNLDDLKTTRTLKSSNPLSKSPIYSPKKGQCFEALGVVASTGGPSALVTIFEALPKNFALPIFLVQHITESFLISFANWLEGLCPFSVLFGKDGEIPVKGNIYLAPEDHHLEVRAGKIQLSKSNQVSLQRPSGTVLFNSMAEAYGQNSIGVLLTGMGDDGASGLLNIHKAGGYTIAEDESTAMVYGMPQVAAKLGAVRELLPLPAIAPHIIDLCSSKQGVIDE
ncbi:MAG: chemotaxis-specific protein-glutamate methyltransferase CheB [Bdellovibrionia bacterium]